MLLLCSSLMYPDRSSKKPPPRASITTANLGKLFSAIENSSAIGLSICGGRLSTTYQSMSSRALATVDRPAPDIPVTTSNSYDFAVFNLDLSLPSDNSNHFATRPSSKSQIALVPTYRPQPASGLWKPPKQALFQPPRLFPQRLLA